MLIERVDPLLATLSLDRLFLICKYGGFQVGASEEVYIWKLSPICTMTDPKREVGEFSPRCPCCTFWERRPTLITDEKTSASKSEKSFNKKKYGNFFVLRNAKVFTLNSDNEQGDDCDEQAAELDVWVGGGKIWALTRPTTEPMMCPTIPGLQEIDVSGMYICPGFVDIHQHVTGGGGEAGFGSRTPEASQSDLIEAGVTTFVSTLGTDTVTRGMENLIAKTRSLCADSGLTGFAWLGGYSFPIENTITGTVRRDISLLPEIIGVGELAISDHRGSYPTVDELTRLVSEARVAGMISGTCGTTYFHLGEDGSALQPLKEVVTRNPLLLKHVVPTHMERSAKLVEQAMQWMRDGGMADLSGWPERQRPALSKYCKSKEGISLIRKKLSISSDSFGSINVFDEEGRLVRYSYGLPSTLLRTFMALVYEENIPLDTVLRFFCRNPASILQLDHKPRYKGRIHVGGDADLLVLKLPPHPLPDDYPRTRSFDMDWPSTDGVLQYMIAGGQVLKSPFG